MRLALFLLAAAAWAQPAVPDTPAGKVFAKWLEAFNTGDRARIEAFLKVHSPGRLERIDETLEFFGETGGFTLLAVQESQPLVLKARLKEKKSDTTALLEMTVSGGEPPVVERMGLRAEAPGAGAPRPPRLDSRGALEALELEADSRAAADAFSGSVLVARNGKVLFSKAYGLADREKKIPNTLETRFRLGSMNKMFTAVAVLQLVSKGKLALDEPIAKYWPDYPNKELAAKVKVRHLLTHTGGTGGFFGPEYQKHRSELRTLADYAKLYGERALKFEPGTRWEYSNYGFLLLGLLVERASGQTYYDYVRANVFKPAGMASTDSYPESESVPGRSIGYMKRQGQWVSNADTLPWRGTSAGGGYSTAGDLLRFAEALRAGKLLPAALLAEATKKQAAEPGAAPGEGYGFGFGVDASAYGHGGGAPGMNGALRIYPKSGVVIVALSNLDPPAASRLASFYEARMPLE